MRRITVAVALGILLSVVALPAAAQAAGSVQANPEITSISSPCDAKTCQLVMHDASNDPAYNPKNMDYSYQFDFHRELHHGFVPECSAGSGDAACPPQPRGGGDITEVYQDEGDHLIQERVVAADNTVSYRNRGPVHVSPAAEASDPPVYEGPTTVAAPALLKVETGKRHVDADLACSNSDQTLVVTPGSGRIHWIHLDVAPVDTCTLTLDAYNLSWQDREPGKPVTLHITGSPPFGPEFSQQVGARRQKGTVSLTEQITFSTGRHYKVVFRPVVQVRQGGTWVKACRPKKVTESFQGDYNLQVVSTRQSCTVPKALLSPKPVKLRVLGWMTVASGGKVVFNPAKALTVKFGGQWSYRHRTVVVK